MTEPQNTEEPQQQDEQVIQPEDGGPAAPDPWVDPRTVRQEDPAAMSETERNRRLSAQYEPPARDL